MKKWRLLISIIRWQWIPSSERARGALRTSEMGDIWKILKVRDPCIEGFHGGHAGGLKQWNGFPRGEKMYCFCLPTWRQWRHMKMLYSSQRMFPILFQRLSFQRTTIILTLTTYMSTEWPQWPDDFKFLHQNFAPARYDCVKVYERKHYKDWQRVVFCWVNWKKPLTFKWSDLGLVKGMRCTRVTEEAEMDNGWDNNYLCTAGDSPYQWVFLGISVKVY